MKFALHMLLLGVAGAQCSLCDSGSGGQGVDALVNPSTLVDSKGKTCAQLMIELFSSASDSPKCREGVSRGYARCCTVNSLPQIVQDPPPAPPQFTISGPFKKCDLCVGGSYPSVTSMVINMLYVGPGTCPQYYEWGQRGWIQDHLCKALQFFAREPCGCSKSGRRLLIGS